MATNDKRLRVTELDFDNIKANLKTFLKAQTEFKDYDFEGSGMNILLDTLAYNTHYLGFNANMLANEMFLDSASLRSSVVSHAKTLGYETTSARASNATINVNLTTDSKYVSIIQILVQGSTHYEKKFTKTFYWPNISSKFTKLQFEEWKPKI